MPQKVAVKALQRRPRGDPRHLVRYLKSQAPGATPADIAKAEGVSIETVRQSIRKIEMDRMRTSAPEMEIAIRSIVVETAPKFTQTMAGLLDAMEMVEVPDARTGKKRLVKVEDKTTRLEAGRLFKDFVAGIQPKAPAIQQSISQTTQVAQVGAGETQEERLRRLRSQAREFNALPPETAAVPTHIDAEDDDEPEEDEDDE